MMDEPALPPKWRYPTPLTLVIAGLVATGLVIGLVLFYRPGWVFDTSTTDTSVWFTPVTLPAGTIDNVMNVTDDLVILTINQRDPNRHVKWGHPVPPDPIEFVAVDLAGRQVLWSQPSIYHDQIQGDAAGLVLRQRQADNSDNYYLLDPHTGEVIGQANSQTRGSSVEWAGDGMILWANTTTLCMTSMTDLATCLWTAPRLASSPTLGVVFAAGALVNTAQGVVDAKTG